MRPQASIVKRLASAGFKVTVTHEPDDTDPRDSFENPKDSDYVLSGIESGDPFAWFVAKVEVSHPHVPNVKGRDILGGCCYGSLADFARDEEGSYYPDMVAEAYRAWAGQVREAGVAWRAGKPLIAQVKEAESFP